MDRRQSAPPLNSSQRHSERRWRAWVQVRLRTLLIACTVAGVALGLWFRPYTIETRRANGLLRTCFEVRRSWPGTVVSHGTQTWHFRDGRPAQVVDYGTKLDDQEFSSLLNQSDGFEGLIWLIEEAVVDVRWGEAEGPGDVNVRGTPDVIVSP